MDTLVKTCCKCKIEKNISLFGKLKNSSDGFRYDCNDCRKEYREKNKTHIKDKQKQFYEKNKDTLIIKNKQYRQDNKEQINEQRKEYRNRPEIVEHRKKKASEYLPVRKKKLRKKERLI